MLSHSHLNVPTEAQTLRPASAYGALRRFTRAPDVAPAPARASVEHCERCGAVLPTEHRHVLDIASRDLVCACTACTLHLDGSGSTHRLIPVRYLALPAFQMTNAQWDDLAIPVNMAFIYRSLGESPVKAFYPSPAGATESLLDLEGWDALVAANPILHELAPEVEALLINRVRDACEHYLVPIDACYQLVGVIRSYWRGLSGGDLVRDKIAEFFGDLRARAHPLVGGSDAEPAV